MLSQLDDNDDYHSQPIDKHRVPPIHQKRLLAFVNHFIVETVDFLNKFINDCDYKFVKFETKLRKVEDSLAILEAKLSSVPDLAAIREPISIKEEVVAEQTKEEVQQEVTVEPKVPLTTIAPERKEEIAVTPTGVRAADDYRYKKFFKMVHFGVQPEAVKQKLASEGLDPRLLDNPNQILSDGQRTPPAEDSSANSSEEDSS